MRACVLLLAVAACGHPVADVAPTDAAVPAASFDDVVAAIAARRTELAADYTPGHLAAARAYLFETITHDLFPLWYGTPWGLGSNSTATRPHEPGMTVGCSYFVTSILGNVGLHLDDRYRFARAPALDIQRSLSSDIHRYLSIPARDLERRIAALGDGLYLIGLSNHIGFVVVSGGTVTLVHASWTGAQRVTAEPLATARAIDVSRKAGYFVSPVLTDRVLDAWLRSTTLRFRSG